LQENLASSKDNTANAEEFGEGEEADVGWSWYVQAREKISSRDYEGDTEKLGW
jgi:hypothetical protein